MTHRRRSSLELEVQRTPTAGGLPLEAPIASLSGGTAGFEGIEQHLAAADGGIAAWRVLGAAFMFEAVLFGEPHLSLPT